MTWCAVSVADICGLTLANTIRAHREMLNTITCLSKQVMIISPRTIMTRIIVMSWSEYSIKFAIITMIWSSDLHTYCILLQLYHNSSSQDISCQYATISTASVFILHIPSIPNGIYLHTFKISVFVCISYVVYIHGHQIHLSLAGLGDRQGHGRCKGCRWKGHLDAWSEGHGSKWSEQKCMDDSWFTHVWIHKHKFCCMHT